MNILDTTVEYIACEKTVGVTIDGELIFSNRITLLDLKTAQDGELWLEIFNE